MEVTSSASEKNSGGAKRRQETPAHNMSCQPPQTLMLESILSERHTGHQEGQSQTKYGHKQDDWPETTGKLTPLP